MTEQIFGLDFGTTKSLAAIVVGGEVQPLKDSSGRPHPSVVWHRGSEIIVGREARSHLENLEGGVEHGFVRSPKMALRREGPLHVGGRSREPVDVVAEVLRHLRTAALEDRRRPYDITQAVMTVPVDFAGPQRRALRDAARKAGIGVFQFVHEPVAALYAFLRSKPDFRRYITELENRVALVFDWGGGTLDLTLCRVLGGSLMQIASRGNSEIGGDRFDEKLRNHVRDKHSAKYHIEDLTMREQPGASAVLLTQCEMAKIELCA